MKLVNLLSTTFAIGVAVISTGAQTGYASPVIAEGTQISETLAINPEKSEAAAEVLSQLENLSLTQSEQLRSELKSSEPLSNGEALIHIGCWLRGGHWGKSLDGDRCCIDDAGLPM